MFIYIYIYIYIYIHIYTVYIHIIYILTTLRWAQYTSCWWWPNFFLDPTPHLNTTCVANESDVPTPPMLGHEG